VGGIRHTHQVRNIARKLQVDGRKGDPPPQKPGNEFEMSIASIMKAIQSL